VKIPNHRLALLQRVASSRAIDDSVLANFG
jgi:hypothetical protein